jgi:hypothetical protein
VGDLFGITLFEDELGGLEMEDDGVGLGRDLHVEQLANDDSYKYSRERHESAHLLPPVCAHLATISSTSDPVVSFLLCLLAH